MNYSKKFFFFLVFVLSIAFSFIRVNGLFPTFDDGFIKIDGDDGFARQLWYMLEILSSGKFFDALADSPLSLIHLIRLLDIIPFLYIGAIIGPVAQILILMLFLCPIIYISSKYKKSPYLLLPFFLPLLISGRAILVVISIGYILVFLLLPRGHSWMLWLGVFFANLSSASALVALLLVFVFSGKDRLNSLYVKLQRNLALFFLFVSTVISLMEKLDGFQSGEAGYEASAGPNDNFLLGALSRSTLVIGFFEGDFLRSALYLLILVYVLFKLAQAFGNAKPKEARMVLYCCLPGFFLEGLGLWAAFFPLFWLALKMDKLIYLQHRYE